MCGEVASFVGAKHIFLVDVADRALERARTWAKLRGLGDKVTVIDARTPNPVDQVVSATKGGVDVFEMARELLPDTRHPVVGVHPVTGRRHLYVNRQFTRRIVELETRESAALLGFLVDHAVQPNHCLRHTWAGDELCLWDERATQHFATADHHPARREMARVAVGDAV